MILVQGDTTSTMAAALAAFYLQIYQGARHNSRSYRGQRRLQGGTQRPGGNYQGPAAQDPDRL